MSKNVDFSFSPPPAMQYGENGERRHVRIKMDGCSDSSSEAQVAQLITVITVVFNGANTLERAILSVANQTCSNIEFIIIDGGSTDGTLDIIRKYAHFISYWVSEPDEGIYDAWNKGVRHARGEWICFLGSDDYFWEPTALEKIICAVNSAKVHAKLVYGRLAVVNARNELLYTIGESWDIAKKRLGDVMSVPHPGMLHHQSWFKEYGLFDATYRIAGDYEMLLRGWPKEDAIFASDVIVVGMMLGGISSTPQNAIKQLKEVWRAQRAHGKHFPGKRLMMAMVRIYLRLMLQTLLTERVTFYLLDIGRKLLGKPGHWTKI